MARSFSSQIATCAIFGALGNVLALLSTQLASLHPQMAVDLSHLGTLYVAATLGPLWGGLTGAIVSFTPFVRFSIQGYIPPLLGLTMFPLKALTGVCAGFLMRKRIRPVFSVPLGYIPESFFTYAVLTVGIRAFLSVEEAAFFSKALVLSILTKAWVEILLLGFLIELLLRVTGKGVAD